MYTSTKPQHSPTPWSADITTSYCRLVDAEGYQLGRTLRGMMVMEQDEANAAYIVKCVNAHDALVEALARCRNELARVRMGIGADFSVIHDANAALALAET